MDWLVWLWEQIRSLFTEYVIEPILNMGWRDALDVIIFALILYELYRFTRNRRAGRVMIGLLLVVVVCTALIFLRLPMLSHIIGLFSAAAFFCVIVIFQPEIRDTLERLGNANFLNPGSDTIPHKHYPLAKYVAEEVVDAVVCMSNTKTGALIIFEGLTKLGDYLDSGKIVDARVTSHLLQNIFFDKAPLHDGALIIRDMRIYAASCVLPSAQGNLKFAGMGTRHRAAVGITEVSDALTVIVSEETGTISVAQDGKLLRGVDKDTLYDVIMTYLAGRLYLRAKRGVYVNPFDRVPKYNRTWKDDQLENEKNGKQRSKTGEAGDDGLQDDQLALDFDSEKTEQDSEM